MKIQEINAFLAICEYGSFTKAAEKIFTTQPTISWQISSLEKELGKQLIVRRKGIHQITLTPAGKLFKPQAEKWAALWNETEEILANQNTDTYDISCVPSFSRIIFPAINKMFSEEFPLCKLSLHGRTTKSALLALERGDYDCSVVCDTQTSGQINLIPLAHEPYVFICHKDAPYGEKIQLSDLNPAHEVCILWGRETQNWHQHYFDHRKKTLAEANAITSVTDYFYTTEAWSIVPYSYLKMCSNYRICKLDILPSDRIFYLASRYPAKEPFYSRLLQILYEIFSTTDKLQILKNDTN